MKAIRVTFLAIIAIASTQLATCQYQDIARDFLGDTSREDQAIRLNSNDAAAYYNRGAIRREHRNRWGAIADFTEVIRINCRNPEAFYNVAGAYYNRGQEYRILGNREKALSDYQKAAALYQSWKDNLRYELVLNDIKQLQPSS